MIQLAIVVHVQGCIGHTDVTKGEAWFVVGWLARVVDGRVGRLVAEWVVVGWCLVSVGWLVGGEW